MAELPASPISPAEFLEGFVPRAFADLDLPEAVRKLELRLGVRLDGRGGGEWLYTLSDGALEVAAGSRETAAFTLIQSVDEWRGALWEGRGGAVPGRALAFLGAVLRRSLAGRAAGDPGSGLIGRLAALDAVMRAVVTGAPKGDWSAAVKFGPGEIPAEPTATLAVDYASAVALARREISPLEAFLAGRVSVAGDMLLVMQLQAILMEVGQAGRGGPGGGVSSPGGSLPPSAVR